MVYETLVDVLVYQHNSDLTTTMNNALIPINNAIYLSLNVLTPFHLTGLSGSVSVDVKEQWTGMTLCGSSVRYTLQQMTLYFENSGMQLTPFTEASVTYDDLVSIKYHTGMRIDNAAFWGRMNIGTAEVCGIPVPVGGISVSGKVKLDIPDISFDALLSYTAASCPKTTISNLQFSQPNVDAYSFNVNMEIDIFDVVSISNLESNVEGKLESAFSDMASFYDPIQKSLNKLFAVDVCRALYVAHCGRYCLGNSLSDDTEAIVDAAQEMLDAARNAASVVGSRVGEEPGRVEARVDTRDHEADMRAAAVDVRQANLDRFQVIDRAKDLFSREDEREDRRKEMKDTIEEMHDDGAFRSILNPSNRIDRREERRYERGIEDEIDNIQARRDDRQERRYERGRTDVRYERRDERQGDLGLRDNNDDRQEARGDRREDRQNARIEPRPPSPPANPAPSPRTPRSPRMPEVIREAVERVQEFRGRTKLPYIQAATDVIQSGAGLMVAGTQLGAGVLNSALCQCLG